MIRTIKLLSAAVFALAAMANAWAEAIRFEPGVYENLLLGINNDGVVTGYYYEEQGQSRCKFFIKGNAVQGVASIAAWEGESRPGQIKAGADEVNLKIEGGQNFPGCDMVLMPEIDTGISYSLVARAPWSELRSIVNEKAYFYSEPKADKQLKSYLVKGDVVGVVASQGEWLQIDYRSTSSGKITRRWIYSRDAAAFESGR